MCALNVKKMKGESKFAPQEAIEVGTYPARIAQIIDLGMQAQTAANRARYGEKKPTHNIQVTYELVDEFMKDEEGNDIEDKPRWQSEFFPLHPLTSDRAKSTQRYKAIDPNEDFEGDFTALIGLPVMVTITQYEKDGTTRNGVGDVSAMRSRDAKKCPELVNDSRVFLLDDPDLELFNALPEFLRNIITSNLEFGGSKLEALINGEEPEEEEKPAPKKAKKQPEPEPEDSDEEDEDEDDKPW